MSEIGSIHTAENHVDTNGIFIDIVQNFLRVKPVLALNGDRDKSCLHFKVASEFLEGHLSVGTHDNVRSGFVDRFASGFAFLLPEALHR